MAIGTPPNGAKLAHNALKQLHDNYREQAFRMLNQFAEQGVIDFGVAQELKQKFIPDEIKD